MINAERLMAWDPGTLDASYGENDTIAYALSIGIGMRPTDPLDLQFVHEKSLRAFPTLPTVLGWPGRLTDPAYGIDHRRVVASDLEVVLHQPLAAQARLSCRPRMAHLIDKGSDGPAILCMERTLIDERGVAVATVRNSILARQQGGFGGSPIDPRPAVRDLPQRPPDTQCDLATPPHLALLFRLHGDTNPIHADPDLAAKAGFPAPLLHGACTFGLAGFALTRQVLVGDVGRWGSMRARFAKPFFPGETLRTEMWLEGSQVLFRCLSLARGEIVLDQGLLTLKDTANSGN
jgi:acyl dehydratase